MIQTAPVYCPQIDRIRAVLGQTRRRALDGTGLVPAAVAVPLVPVGGDLAVLLTVRTHHVEHHKGEISFPGGRADPDDPDTRATALRETWEEVGIAPADLEVLGTLDDFASITGYRVTPHVVWLPRPEYPLRPEPREVAEVLRVPLGHLRTDANHRQTLAPGGGHRVHEYRWGPHRVWGLTAAILHRFLSLLDDGDVR